MMSNYKNHSKKELDNVMSEQRFNQIVDAIVKGEYSWACVLILETAGYNPLHYIPYRTYNRLIKKHCQSSQTNYNQSKTSQKLHENFKSTP